MAAVLIIFAKEPVPGQVKTRLAAHLGPGPAAQLYRQFLLDVLAEMGTLTGLHLALAFSPATARDGFAGLAPGVELVAQADGDLGARLAAAFAWGFGAGYAPVIIRNSDSPDLPARLVTEAAEVLAGGAADLAVGPCPDGGYYLVGLRAPAPALFADVPWSSGKELARTLANARRLSLRPRLLAPWADIDTLDDLQAFLRQPLAPSAPGRPSQALARRLLPAPGANPL